jgi:small subunit ribosomal protein S2
MCHTIIDKKEKKEFNNLSYNKKAFLIEQFFSYKALVGNKIRFTNPQSYEYIFGLNFNKNTIFNINKSLVLLRRALNLIQKIKENKGNILFVGTRFDTRKIVENIAIKTSSPYINYKWPNGLLTNWENNTTSLKFYHLFLKKLKMRKKGHNKMKNTFSGLTSMNKLPDAIFIMDLNTDFDAFKEAKALNIPIIALIDSNIPARMIDYPIPANSDSILSIIFFANLIISSIKKI